MPDESLMELNRDLSILTRLRQMSELYFAVSLGGESCGAQYAGGATTITAEQVNQEPVALANLKEPSSISPLRVFLVLHCRLA
jgi:hypothetical protein